MGSRSNGMEPVRWVVGSAGDPKGVYITTTNALVKYGPQVSASREAALMRYVLQKCPEIPVPVVYDTWTTNTTTTADDIGTGTGTETGYISMSPMPGEELASAWPWMDKAEKDSVMDDYKMILWRLRSVDPSSPDELQSLRIGAIAGEGPAIDHDRRRRRLSSDGKEKKKKMRHGGPFATEAEFNTWLRSLDSCPPYSEEEEKDSSTDFYSDLLKDSMRTDHKWRLTHGSLGPRNVLVSHGRVTAVLGWGAGGWYPEYWEFVKMVADLPRSVCGGISGDMRGGCGVWARWR